MRHPIFAIATLAAVSLAAPALAAVPGTHPHRGKHHGDVAGPVAATTPSLKGTSREDADKAYRKKYGF